MQDKDLSNLTLYVNAGHGGLDSAGNYRTFAHDGKHYEIVDNAGSTIMRNFEGVTNRIFATLIMDKARKLGAEVIQIHENIIDTWNWQRTQKANKHYAVSMQDKSKRQRRYLWLSLHSNAFASTFKGLSTSPRGIEIFTSIGKTFSDDIASLIMKELENDLQVFNVPFRKDFSDRDGDKEANFEELVSTAMPAVLIENLFFTNETDAKLLLNKEYQTTFTDAVIKALLQV